jgi:predicted Holliday junction resolvase-like endonuclease
MFDDLLYHGETEKQRKRRKLEEARRKGRAGEEMYRFQATLQGKEVERTGRGHDFIERRRDLFTGKVTSTKYVEVKTGRARLSELQKNTKKKKKGGYKVVREETLVYW